MIYIKEQYTKEEQQRILKPRCGEAQKTTARHHKPEHAKCRQRRRTNAKEQNPCRGARKEKSNQKSAHVSTVREQKDKGLDQRQQRTGGRRHAIASIIDKPLPFDKVPSHYVRMVSVVAVPAVKEHSGKK